MQRSTKTSREARHKESFVVYKQNGLEEGRKQGGEGAERLWVKYPELHLGQVREGVMPPSEGPTRCPQRVTPLGRGCGCCWRPPSEKLPTLCSARRTRTNPKKSPGQPQKKSDLNRFFVALFANEGDLLVLISLLDLKAPRAQPTLPRTFLLFSNKLTSLLRFLFSITTKKRCCSSR